MKYIKTNMLEVGMMIATSIYNNRASMLLAANSVLTATNIKALKRLGYKGVYIYENGTPETFKSILSDSTRLMAIKSLKHLNVDECLYVANAITNEILSKPDVVYDMVSISSYDNSTYVHSINVATLSTMIGVNLGLTNDMLYKVAQAAILHDIGKTAINPDIIKKEGRLTDEEFAEIKRHPEYGYYMLRQNDMISSVVRNAVYSHHENEDGSGYPRGLKGNKIHIVAKIIHVADVYDALTSKRSYKDEMPADEALAYMTNNIGTLFDKNVVTAMLHCVAPYPVGVDVVLSTGKIATVVKVNKNNITKPIVKINESGDRLLDLADFEGISITKTLR